MQRIKISDDRRNLVTEDGAPFFWLADTAWELFHRANFEDACHYLDVRASQGFNVVQAVVLAELDGLHTPNENGHLPLIEDDPCRPNEPYFEFIDSVIGAAASRDMYMAILPAWGDKVQVRYDWAVGPEIFDEDNAFSYGRWLAQRWAPRPSVIWVLGGDRNPDDKALRIWRAMAAGITAIDKDALITFHPQPMEGGSSSGWFHHEDWLKFNMLQTGHDRDAPVADIVARDYGLMPVKPVLNGEPTYEAHPISFKLSEGYSTDADIRRDAYLGVFAGACGHTYGCHSVWQLYSPAHPGINHPILAWKDALHLAGANQMKHLARLIMHRNPLQRIPCPELCKHPDTGALIANDGSYAYIYLTRGGTIDVDTNLLTGSQLRTHWMNPKDGTITEPQSISKGGTQTFISPNSGPGCDWVLIMETA